MNDRLTEGFFSGLIAGVVMDSVHAISYFLGINELTFFDWSGNVVLGHRPHTLWEFLQALAVQIFFTAFLGIVFAYVIPKFKSTNILFKGWIFSLVAWFILNSLALLFRINSMLPRRVDTATADVVTVSLYGIVLAYVYTRFRKKSQARLPDS